MKDLKKKNVQKDTEDETEDESESSSIAENIGERLKQVISEENNGIVQTDGNSEVQDTVPEKEDARKAEVEKTDDPSSSKKDIPENLIKWRKDDT